MRKRHLNRYRNLDDPFPSPAGTDEPNEQQIPYPEKKHHLQREMFHKTVSILTMGVHNTYIYAVMTGGSIPEINVKVGNWV